MMHCGCIDPGSIPGLDNHEQMLHTMTYHDIPCCHDNNKSMLILSVYDIIF